LLDSNNEPINNRKCHEGYNQWLVETVPEGDPRSEIGLKKINKAPSVSVIVISSGHRLLRWDSYKGVYHTLTSEEFKYIVQDQSSRSVEVYFIDCWQANACTYSGATGKKCHLSVTSNSSLSFKARMLNFCI